MYRVETVEKAAPPFPSSVAHMLPQDPPALPAPSRGWLQWLGLAISAGTFAAILYQIRHVNPGEVLALLPERPEFWLAFALYYTGPVLCEWVIYRRLWKIPLSGLFALTRKYVGNEILLGYIGEAYFYVWARARTRMTASPFGAIKDVAILSALVGNLVTLLLLAIAYPALAAIHVGSGERDLYLSMGVLVASSLATLLFRRRLFSLANSELRFVAAVHLVRVLGVTLLAGVMWHFALPGIWLGWWILLAALRQLLSRLPLLPNKDLVFAGLATLIVGSQSQIAALLTMTAGLLLLTHITAGLISIAADFVNPEE